MLASSLHSNDVFEYTLEIFCNGSFSPITCFAIVLSLVASRFTESSFQPLFRKGYTKEEVTKLIKTHGTKSPYYFEGLSYKVANIDKDNDFELVAKIDGGVHVGHFFIFDKSSQGKYTLVAQKDWKVEKWDL